jgi:hypothetical protein
MSNLDLAVERSGMVCRQTSRWHTHTAGASASASYETRSLPDHENGSLWEQRCRKRKIGHSLFALQPVPLPAEWSTRYDADEPSREAGRGPEHRANNRHRHTQLRSWVLPR